MNTSGYVGVVVVLAMSPLAAQSTPAVGHDSVSSAVGITDSEVTAAFALGPARKNKQTYGYSGAANCTKFANFLMSNSNMRIYGVIAQGPFGRVVDASAQATRRYLPFGLADVTPDMRAPTVTVGIEQYMEDMNTKPIAVEHVVIRGTNPSDTIPVVLQPTHVEELPESYQNLMGAKVQTKGILATFDARTLPAGDLQIVVILADGECHVTIHEGNRAKIH
jgi:hypothetical protein